MKSSILKITEVQYEHRWTFVDRCLNCPGTFTGREERSHAKATGTASRRGFHLQLARAAQHCPSDGRPRSRRESAGSFSSNRPQPAAQALTRRAARRPHGTSWCRGCSRRRCSGGTTSTSATSSSRPTSRWRALSPPRPPRPPRPRPPPHRRRLRCVRRLCCWSPAVLFSRGSAAAVHSVAIRISP